MTANIGEGSSSFSWEDSTGGGANPSDDSDNLIDTDGDDITVNLGDPTTLLRLDLRSGADGTRDVEHNFLVFDALRFQEFSVDTPSYGYYDGTETYANSGDAGDLWYKQTQYRDLRPNGDDSSYHNVYAVYLYNDDGDLIRKTLYRIVGASTFTEDHAFDRSFHFGAAAADLTFLGEIQYEYNSDGDLINKIYSATVS